MTDREQYAPSPAAGRSFAGSGPLTSSALLHNVMVIRWEEA
jgi:hypothetical protein